MPSDAALPISVLAIASSRWGDVLAEVKRADPAVAARWLHDAQAKIIAEIERGRRALARFENSSPAATEFWIARCSFASRRLADLRGMLLEATAREDGAHALGGAAALRKARERGLVKT